MFDYGFAAARKKTWLHKLPAKIAGPRDALSSPPGVQEDGAREELRMCPPTPEKTRPLTRPLWDVWFSSQPLPRLLGSLFGSLFAGEREPAHAEGGGVCVGCGGLRTPRNPRPHPAPNHHYPTAWKVKSINFILAFPRHTTDRTDT